MRHFIFSAVVVSLIFINTIRIKTKFSEPLDSEKTIQTIDSENVIHTFFVVNDNYVKYLSVAMASILKNTKSHIFFHIMDDNINEKTKNKLLKLLKYKNFSIEFLPINYAKSPDLPDSFMPHINKTTNYRLLISHLKPDIKKCIFNDADLIYVSDIKELWNINIEDYYMAAVPDPSDMKRAYNHIKVFPLNKNEHYVNTGVTILNLEKWRQNNIEAQFISNAAKYSEKLFYPDQDLLNITLHDKIKYLSPRFNAMPEQTYYSLSEQIKAFESPAVIHWAGPRKPWQNCNTHLSETFWEYVHLSPFAPEIYMDYYFSKLGISNKNMITKLHNLIP